jgi:predicted dehydrogenase
MPQPVGPPTSLRANRRQALKLTAGLFAAPAFVPRLISAAPSERVRHASFGAGGMANADLSAIAEHKDVQLVAVADVDLKRAEELKKRFPEIKVYKDYRVLLAELGEKELDSVNVSTPDHMHAPIAADAMARGLAVYGQKPLTHDIFESRRLREIADQKKLVTQMGIQVHSAEAYKTAVAWVQDGVIGKIKEVHTWSSKKWGDPAPQPNRTDVPPESLDWGLWLGVCQDRPYIGEGYYHPGNWRKRLDFGTGTFGDMGCHIYDPVFKALDLTAPVSVTYDGNPPNATNWANDAQVLYVFPGTKVTDGKTVNVTWYDGDRRPPESVLKAIAPNPLPDQGSVFFGTTGIMILPHVGLPIIVGEDPEATKKREKAAGKNHWFEFVDAVKGKGSTSTPFSYSGPLTESILLGGVASRFPGTKLDWYAEAMRFPEVPQADRYVRKAYRPGWEIPGLG